MVFKGEIRTTVDTPTREDAQKLADHVHTSLVRGPFDVDATIHETYVVDENGQEVPDGR